MNTVAKAISSPASGAALPSSRGCAYASSVASLAAEPEHPHLFLRRGQGQIRTTRSSIDEWEAHRTTLIAGYHDRKTNAGATAYRFDIRLLGEGETVFFDV